MVFKSPIMLMKDHPKRDLSTAIANVSIVFWGDFLPFKINVLRK